MKRLEKKKYAKENVEKEMIPIHNIYAYNTERLLIKLRFSRFNLLLMGASSTTSIEFTSAWQ